VSKLGEVIAKEEGYGIPGTLPTRNNNPGDLRHSPNSFHSPSDPNAIGQIKTPQLGWDDLERQLKIDAGRGMSVQELIYSYCPPGVDNNNPAGYLTFVCANVPCSPDDSVAEVLTIPGEYINE
jgi:hypothetical protein